ncbi:hypothetical protein KIN20_013357 [Parelaphostrongylus tenuis]|uniref:Uncharacterized protein n=1 Tax=Parelaphostrongylus tenuis TaxID=148309 RepID=A0AAD5MVZ9_PARTN|nr:hypothetical protein KIN20_013357 [Parelaphostrongylus tenuis]
MRLSSTNVLLTLKRNEKGNTCSDAIEEKIRVVDIDEKVTSQEEHIHSFACPKLAVGNPV